jgi:hypothetical protein
MPGQIATVRAHRERVGGPPVEIGAINLSFVYVGTPSWDAGKGVLSGTPDDIAASLREYKDMGVSHLQVRFKARSCDELEDQMRAFGADVVPLIN